MRYYVDLKPYFNLRMAYPQDTALNEVDYIGTHNYFFIQEGMEWGIISNHEAAIKLERTDNFDCIECNNQIIEVPGITGDKIVIAGCCIWEFYNEKFKIEYDDGSTEYVPVCFGDWARSIEDFTKYTLELETSQYEKCKILKECPRRDGTAYIYYVAASLNHAQKVKRIIFPDNICMFIFGITLEAR